MLGSLLRTLGPYRFTGTIGDGATCIVRLCRNESGEFLACKIVEKSLLTTDEVRSRFEREIRINQQLHHPGIVRMLDLYADKDNYYMFMEFCPGGDLFEHIIEKARLMEDEARQLFRQILEAVHYLHSLGVSHRDLKPENILMTRDERLKISDFGLSSFVNSEGLVKTSCGSTNYASPECLSGKPYDGRMTDMWSCGVILYVMVTGQLPWTKRNEAEKFEQIKAGDFTIPKFVSESAQELIRGLMNVDGKARLTAEQALNHPWLREVPQQFDENDRKGYVSLRQVDQYFMRDIPGLDLGELKASGSTMEWTFDQMGKIVSSETWRRERQFQRSPSTRLTKLAIPLREMDATREDDEEYEALTKLSPRTRARKWKQRPLSTVILQCTLSSKPAAEGKTVNE